jgi:hypothetical protein
MIPRYHRPWFKVAINTVLRAFQTWRQPTHVFVLISVFDDRTEQLIGYRFGWVRYVP